MTEYKFSDVKRGDRAVFVKGDHRVEMVVTTPGDRSAESPEFCFTASKGWKVADIIKVLPTEPGSRLNKPTVDDVSYEFAIRTCDTTGDYSQWVVFDADGSVGYADDDDIKSWENA